MCRFLTLVAVMGTALVITPCTSGQELTGEDFIHFMSPLTGSWTTTLKSDGDPVPGTVRYELAPNKRCYLTQMKGGGLPYVNGVEGYDPVANYTGRAPIEAAAQKEVEQKIHMDVDSGTDHMPTRLVIGRAAGFFGWLLAFMFSMWLIGLIPTVPIFVIALMRIEGNEPWKLVLPQAIILPIFIWVVFDQLLTIPWPPTLMGTWLPFLKGVIPSM